jgi:hypothetical protein
VETFPRISKGGQAPSSGKNKHCPVMMRLSKQLLCLVNWKPEKPRLPRVFCFVLFLFFGVSLVFLKKYFAVLGFELSTYTC